MKSKLTKNGKKTKNSFLKKSLFLSFGICVASVAVFLPLLKNTGSANQTLMTEIDNANRQTEIIQKNNQDAGEKTTIEIQK